MGTAIRANVRELIRLIGLNLYHDPSVVVRELLQNASDSILSRFGDTAGLNGNITVHVGQSPMTLRFLDNGTGMDRQDLDEYLSTIGQGIKKAGAGAKADATIGEYGIGFYSSFMIADEIIVTTRKDGNPTLRWRSVGLEEYDIEELPSDDRAYGTEVSLLLQRKCAEYSNAGFLRRLIIRHCDYIKCPIHLAGSKPVNARLFPWEVGSNNISQQIERHLGRPAIFWTSSKSPTQEVQLFLAYSDTPETRQEIYCKRIFVTDALRFVPDHLSFLDVIVNSDSLSLTLSRQSPIQNQSFRSMMDFVETSLTTFLRQLITRERNNPHFIKMLRDNQAPFRRLAAQNRSALDKLYDLLLFRLAGTSTRITITDYITQAKGLLKGRVLFVREPAEGIAGALQKGAPRPDRLALAAAQEAGVPIIAIESDEDEELLRKICTKVGLDKAPFGQHKSEVLASDSPAPVPLLKVRGNFERFLGARTYVHDFQPAAVPILIDDNGITLNVNSSLLGILEGLSANYERVRPIYVHLHKIMRTLDRSGVSKGELVEIAGAIASGIESWCEEVMAHSRVASQLNRLCDRWWTGPLSLDVLANDGAAFQRDGEMYRHKCFIACPFADTYRDVINVIRSVLRCYGVYAETADDVDSRSLMEKICLRIDESQLAIVDVSEANPNVLFELGVLLARRKPAIIIRNTGIAEWTGIRIPSDLVGVEHIDYRNTSEDLQGKLDRLCRRVFGGANAKKP